MANNFGSLKRFNGFIGFWANMCIKVKIVTNIYAFYIQYTNETSSFNDDDDDGRYDFKI